MVFVDFLYEGRGGCIDGGCHMRPGGVDGLKGVYKCAVKGLIRVFCFRVKVW